MTWPRKKFDRGAYLQEVLGGRECFICRLAKSDPLSAEEVFRDDAHIVFLNRFPTLEGYVLIAPLEHREQVISDFSLDDYLSLQALVYRVGEALSEIVPTERLYVLSVGSQEGNSHVHWHVASLPPGTKYEDQQLAALMAERIGYLDIPQANRLRFADLLRQAMKT
ncbi:MAG TPA: HIT domain-containing protein [Acidimicrobiales bacterium]|nr:HIT domain-containing protein [Acidimicrobiales bacterium]